MMKGTPLHMKHALLVIAIFAFASVQIAEQTRWNFGNVQEVLGVRASFNLLQTGQHEHFVNNTNMSMCTRDKNGCCTLGMIKDWDCMKEGVINQEFTDGDNARSLNLMGLVGLDKSFFAETQGVTPKNKDDRNWGLLRSWALHYLYYKQNAVPEAGMWKPEAIPDVQWRLFADAELTKRFRERLRVLEATPQQDQVMTQAVHGIFTELTHARVPPLAHAFEHQPQHANIKQARIDAYADIAFSLAFDIIELMLPQSYYKSLAKHASSLH